jgi:hypothetical protein
VSGSLSQSGVLSGAIPAAPGAAGVSAAHRATHLDFISLAPAEVLRLAAAKKLPPRLQHVLSTVQEGARDAGVDESTLQTHEETLRAAKAVWGTADPLSRHLHALQMHACSGEGHMWVLDAGRRSDQFGRPRKGALHLHTDGPLDALLYRVAVRSRLMLPIGYLIREAQRHGGYDDTTWPLCHCHACRRRGQDGTPKRLDCMGMHLGTRVADGGYTPRHHTFNEAFTALVRAAGYSASIEKNPFKENKDRVARPPVRGRAEVPADGEVTEGESSDSDDDLGAEADGADETRDVSKDAPAAPGDGTYVPKSRLDTIIRAVPLVELREVLPADMLAHLDPDRDAYVDVLVDYTFTHPGAFLSSGIRATRVNDDLRNPDAAGDLAVKRKNDKYLAKAVAHRQVLLPFHISAYGRIHPLASSFMQYICSKVAVRKLHSPQPWTFPQSDPATRVTLLTRSYLRNLSTCVQRSFALGLIQAARRVVCPRQAVPFACVLDVSLPSQGVPLRPTNRPVV